MTHAPSSARNYDATTTLVRANLSVLLGGEREIVLREECLSWREIDGEVVVLDKRSWTYMGINGSGTLLWKEIESQGATPSELVACLCDAFDVSEDLAFKDVASFLAMLESHDLLETMG